eukprot:Nk52_evm4s245 gene=Nk52_evmTU4s245
MTISIEGCSSYTMNNRMNNREGSAGTGEAGDGFRPGKFISGKGRGSGTGAKLPKGYSNRMLGTYLKDGNPATENVKAQTRFEAVRRVHQQSLEHAAAKLEQEGGDRESSEDSELEEDVILLNTFKEYSALSDTPLTPSEAVRSSCRANNSVCLICIDNVRHVDPVWSCESCAALFHLPCIQRWIKEGTHMKQNLEQNSSTNSNDKKASLNIKWHCPKCRLEYTMDKYPSKYLCYCGKQVDPPFDPWALPHSCGEICGKPLTQSSEVDSNSLQAALPRACNHKCRLLCHPGACPDCPVLLPSQPCFCGKVREAKRCAQKLYSCKQVCGRPLVDSCTHEGDVHLCPLECHVGPCPPCAVPVERSCECGKTKKNVECFKGVVLRCEQKCGRLLGCGSHKCEKACHSEKEGCGACPKARFQFCPCGKLRQQVESCLDVVPCCGDTCGKTLPCGIHTCVERCHTGTCSSKCRYMVSRKCRCGSVTRKMQCYESKRFFCDRKCTQMRNCGRHQCKKKCCTGNCEGDAMGASEDAKCPPCTELCNRKLQCGNHRCPAVCHDGPCYPCPRVSALKCFCGKTQRTVPCGRERTSKPPKCRKMCCILLGKKAENSEDICEHIENEHACHFGDCPKCEVACNRELFGCQHKCKAKCHGGIRSKCPPCEVPVTVMCKGGHERKEIPCHALGDRVYPGVSVVEEFYQCGSQCGKSLSCNQHVCANPCHSPTDHCPPCEMACTKTRSSGLCKHPCSAFSCHSGPCPPCPQYILMDCHCLTTKLTINCDEWSRAKLVSQKGKGNNHQRDLERILCCLNTCPRRLKCGHTCSKTCHSLEYEACSSEKDCTRKVTVRCPCRNVKKIFMCKEIFAKGAQSIVKCDSTCGTRVATPLGGSEENLSASNAEVEAKSKERKEYERMERKLNKSRGIRNPSYKNERKEKKRAEEDSRNEMPKLLKSMLDILQRPKFWAGVCIALFVVYLAIDEEQPDPVYSHYSRPPGEL